MRQTAGNTDLIDYMEACSRFKDRNTKGLDIAVTLILFVCYKKIPATDLRDTKGYKE